MSDMPPPPPGYGPPPQYAAVGGQPDGPFFV